MLKGSAGVLEGGAGGLKVGCRNARRGCRSAWTQGGPGSRRSLVSGHLSPVPEEELGGNFNEHNFVTL